MSSSVLLYADGASRGNPGPAAAGALLLDREKNILSTVSQYLGEATNNVAEYSALILGLQEAERLKIQEIIVRMDSELIVRQILGVYQVRHPGLRELFEKALRLRKKFQKFHIEHVRREQNRQADQLANEALDRQFSLNKPLS